MSEFSIGTHHYKTARLDAMSQWAVARRLAPVVAKILTPDVIQKGIRLAPKFKDLQAARQENGNVLEDPNFVEFLDLLSSLTKPFMDGLASMSDADSDFVINACLAATSRQQGQGGWAVVKPTNSNIMFADIDMAEMLQIVVRVIMDNLANFSFASLQTLAPQK